MKTVVLFGGSFNPIHKMHIKVAKYVNKTLSVDEIWFLPTKNTPLKETEQISYKHRYNMVKRATNPYKYMKVKNYELKMSDISYTYNVVKYIKKIHKDINFIWLIGDDQAQQLDKWYKIDELIKEISIVVVQRKEEVANPYNLMVLSNDKLDISSTSIRDGDLSSVDKSVRRYIIDNQLYIDTIIKVYMNDKRYKHSLSVAMLAKKIAIANNMNANNAYIAGLLHDIAKCYSQEQLFPWMKMFYKEHLDCNFKLWHAYVGALWARKYFNINSAIYNAIYNHVNCESSNKLDRVIYVSDKLDPLREQDNEDNIKACINNIDNGYEIVKNQQDNYLKSQGIRGN